MAVDLDDMVKQILSGDRRMLAKAMTLVESHRAQDGAEADQLLERLYPHAGNSLRIAISGIPGVGKSTMIEALGNYLIQTQGKKVAVLAIDPSSPVSGGSIMGDRTRMTSLSASTQAFIRPSPTGATLGGVAEHTAELMVLCEAAGYDVVVVETVGVGQSEYQAASMTDVFVLLAMPGTGDELQNIKKGIYELADIVAITKADGNFLQAAELARSQHEQSLHMLFAGRPWVPPVVLTSVHKSESIALLWEKITFFAEHQRKSAAFVERRRQQAFLWFERELESRMRHYLENVKSTNQTTYQDLQSQIEQQKVHPHAAAKKFLAGFLPQG